MRLLVGPSLLRTVVYRLSVADCELLRDPNSLRRAIKAVSPTIHRSDLRRAIRDICAASLSAPQSQEANRRLAGADAESASQPDRKYPNNESR